MKKTFPSFDLGIDHLFPSEPEERKQRKEEQLVLKLDDLVEGAQAKTMYLLTEWEGRTGKYLARGPYVLTESRIYPHPARPYSVNKYFIIWPLTVENFENAVWT